MSPEKLKALILQQPKQPVERDKRRHGGHQQRCSTQPLMAMLLRQDGIDAHDGHGTG